MPSKLGHPGRRFAKDPTKICVKVDGTIPWVSEGITKLKSGDCAIFHPLLTGPCQVSEQKVVAGIAALCQCVGNPSDTKKWPASCWCFV